MSILDKVLEDKQIKVSKQFEMPSFEVITTYINGIRVLVPKPIEAKAWILNEEEEL